MNPASPALALIAGLLAFPPLSTARPVILAGSLETTPPPVVRSVLSEAEASAPFEVEIALRCRRFAELQARVGRGEKIAPSEVAGKYLPDPADGARIAAWCRSRGLTVTRNDSHPLGVFARGTAAQVAAAFGTQFGRLRRAGKEMTGAITAPSIPEEFAPVVLAINGLQPRPAPTMAVAAAGGPYVGPADIANLYGAAGTGLTGAGQTIAIIMDCAPTASDLTAFWADCQVPQSLDNVIVIPVGGGPSSAGHLFEASLDVEWASGLAPAAKIRLYAIPAAMSLAQIDQALAQIIADLPSNPGLHQVSISIGLPESACTLSLLQSSSQYFAVLASAGVTCFAGSGDGGSNPDPSVLGEYNPAAAAQVCYPASDPNVVAVGGTSLDFSNPGGAGEAVWGLRAGATYPDGHGYDATGGGYSLFPRPAWQAGLPGTAAARRCVPDVAGPAISNPYGLVVANGQAQGVIGTSWSTPVWAAFCALLNQARASAQEPPLGLLAPRLYALSAAGNFRAAAAGTNGAYTADGSGSYNFCVGLGSPLFGGLLHSLVQSPTLTTQPVGVTVGAGGSASLSASAAGPGPLSYQWQLNGAAIPGATSAVYTLDTVAVNQGGSYRVIVSNASGSVASLPATVTVALDARLVNLSARAPVSPGAGVFDCGFAIRGTASKRVLLRGVGPTLVQYGLQGALADPLLGVYDSSQAEIASAAAWGGSPALAAAFALVGAFSLPPSSADSALLLPLAPGPYTAELSAGAAPGGIALAEIYDADTGASDSRLVNLSARGSVSGGSGILGAGFVIAGTTSDTVLIRAIGPGLAQYGVAGFLASPRLTLRDASGATITANAGWGGGASLASLFSSLGAFALPAGSSDCALLATLPPGNYTAEVSGGGASGVALVEVYEVSR